MPKPWSSTEQDSRLMWALTVIGTCFLVSVLPAVSWFTPGSAGRYRTLLYLLIVGATVIAWRLRYWPIAVGGIGFVWLTSDAAQAASPGG